MGLLQMSFSGAALILAIVVIRAVALNKLPKKTFFVLWEIALLRLIIPFSVPSVLSVYSIINQNTVINTLRETPVGNIIRAMQGGPFELSGEMSKTSTHYVSTWFAAWIMGMVACTAFFAISYIHYRVKFLAPMPVHNDFVKKWLREHPLKRPVSVKQTDGISAPLTYGIFKPVILVPENTEWENAKQLQYVFLHEYVHICRFDSVTKLLSTAALCVHWFNPLVWVMYILFDRDIELSCDESVVCKLGTSERSAYAKMLISMEAKKSGLMPFYSSFSKNAIEERIEAIMRMKKATILSLGAAVIVIAGVATMFATSAVENRKDHFDLSTFIDGDIAKVSEYSDYIENRLASVIENNYENTSCCIDISYSNGEIVSADIRVFTNNDDINSMDIHVFTENDETNVLETEILELVSKSLGISAENITLFIK